MSSKMIKMYCLTSKEHFLVKANLLSLLAKTNALINHMDENVTLETNGLGEWTGKYVMQTDMKDVKLLTTKSKKINKLIISKVNIF